MSSGSSGRYQSKLFNFVHQQSRRLTAQWEDTFRHVQVATKWGVELLLYPVYLLLHSSQSPAKQLQTKEPQSRLQLKPETPPTVDTPIEQVLATVQNLPSASPTEAAVTQSPSFHLMTFIGDLWGKLSHHRPQSDSSLSQSLTIPESATVNSLSLTNLVVQGVATSLENRHLVLITPENAVLDILTPQQQAQLEERIMNAIADYWRALRVWKSQPAAAILPEIDRLLAKLTGSKSETTPALLTGNTINSALEPEYLSPSTKLLAFVDAFVAKLESNAVLPVKENSQDMLTVVQTQFHIFLYGEEELAARGQIAVTNDGLDSQTLNLQELIAAAINYFFGVSTKKNLNSGNADNPVSRKRLFQGNSPQSEDLAIDPWLSWSDLFGEVQTPHKQTVAVPKPNQLPLSPPQNFTGSRQNRFTSQQQATGGEKKPKKASQAAITNTNKSQISPSRHQNQKGKLAQQPHPSQQIEAQPDWIDVEAIDVGYEKHILEQLLAWLDGAMLWLEELLVKILQWLQQLWRGK